MKKANEKERGQHCPKKLIVRELISIRGGILKPGATLPPDRGKTGN
jgi:hypothetical protein